MGIKLIKKESMERCDSCGAIMTEYDYDRYGGLCKHCRSKESKQESGLDANTFAEPSFGAVAYGLEEISKNDSGEIEVVDGVDSDGSVQALADEVDALHKRHPEKKYHITAIGTDSDGIADKSEVIWSDYPEEVKKSEDASSVDDLLARHNQKWLVKVSYDVDASHSAVAPSIVRADTKDAATNIALKRHRGLGDNMKVVSVEPMTESRKKSDGFAHVWELQAQQAKETLEELTKKFGDADRLAFEIRNFPHREECDVVVTVDGNPFITAEFEGGRHGGIRWHCFEDDVSDVHLDAGDEDAAKNMVLAFKADILDALESLYGFGAIADEGGQRSEKTAWSYLVELEELEGAESRQEATGKILKALEYNPGTEGRWYDKDGEEISLIDVLDNTEWDFAVKTCGQLQESKQKKVCPKFVQINTQEDFDKYIKPALGKGADACGLSDVEGMWWEIADGEKIPASAKTVREIRDGISKSPRFIFISGAGDERSVADMALTAYASEMGMTTKEYLDGYNPGGSEPTKSEGSQKQETAANPRWCVEFGDIYSNVEKEYYDTEEDAKARYDELAERGDIEWVEDPVMEAAEEVTVSYDDYAESVKSILMGREFEYGPETANQFVVDDYKDIVHKNFDAGKSAFTAAADIDDAYMGKE